MIGIYPPWGNVLGLARTLIYSAIGLTLLLTPGWVLFTPLLGVEPQYGCEGIRNYTLFCSIPDSGLSFAQYISGSFMLVAAIGFYPALFAVPSAYIAFSLSLGTSLPDGGDQIASSLLILLTLNGLSDWRRSHWSPSEYLEHDQLSRVRIILGGSSLFLARLQVSIVYFFAGIEKLSSGAWADGSAIYMWIRHISFGAPEWLRPLLWHLTEVPLFSASITWATMGLEVALGVSLLLPRNVAVKLLLPAGVLFHVGILFAMGIASFAVVMVGALLILLPPPGSNMQSPTRMLEGFRSIFSRGGDKVLVSKA